MSVLTMCALAAVAGGAVSAAVLYKAGFEEGYDEAVRSMARELDKAVAR